MLLGLFQVCGMELWGWQCWGKGVFLRRARAEMPGRLLAITQMVCIFKDKHLPRGLSVLDQVVSNTLLKP